MQAKLESLEIVGVAGAGLVHGHAERQGRTAGGSRSIRSSPIRRKSEMLEDLIVAAHRDAKEQDRGADGGGDAEGHRRHATAAGDEAAVLVAGGPSMRRRDADRSSDG